MRLDSLLQPREGRGSGRKEGGRRKEGARGYVMFGNSISTRYKSRGLWEDRGVSGTVR